MVPDATKDAADRGVWPTLVHRNHWALAIILAALLGLVEGTLTASGMKTAIGLWSYWIVLFALPMVALASSLGLSRALAHLPLVIVVQDWFSLVAQGGAPQKAFWYEEVFGSHILTWHYVYVPNFYYIGFAATLLMHVALDLWPTGRTRREAAQRLLAKVRGDGRRPHRGLFDAGNGRPGAPAFRAASSAPARTGKRSGNGGGAGNRKPSAAGGGS